MNMNKKQILQVSLAGIIGFVIYVAVSILSGEIERWKKLIIFSVTYAILLPLVRYIKLCYTSPACTLYKKV